MSLPEIKYCPGTLAEGYNTYSRTCLNRVFSGKKVHHILPYPSPASDPATGELFDRNRRYVSISGVQVKFSVRLQKNRLRLVREGERGEYILKPAPGGVRNSGQLPANEHLTMQIARQVYKIETAENALIFFNNGDPAYITRRFDINDNGSKRAQDDFASIAGRTPPTHGQHYKYTGNYLQIFKLMEAHLPAYKLEAPKLFRILIFNYLFSNGDAHFKNFSILETPMGDYRLSPAYDLLNSRIHIEDTDFALDEGLLPGNLSRGTIRQQFQVLAEKAGIPDKVYNETMTTMLGHQESVEKLVLSSFLNNTTRRKYLQHYLTRLTQLKKTSV